MAASLRVLVVGSGAREHALAVRLLESDSVAEVIVSPGNAGTLRTPVWATGKLLRSLAGEPIAIATSERVDLAVVGPEAPLVDGLADRLRASSVPTFGPSAAAARLEGSKAFMKAFAARHGLRTARHETVHDVADLERVVRSFPDAPVIKADGLCAGKGVVVAETHDEACAAARHMLSGAAFGAAGAQVVVEERLFGAEASVHAICDGARCFVLPAAQDHKRIGENDTGPNTGGMGAYAPAPLITPALHAKIASEFMQRALDGMRADGAPFVGALFAGLMVTASGEPVLLEFNVRFGDPETEVLMAVLDGDLAQLLLSAARGELARDAMHVSADHALCVVLAAAGYPAAPRGGDAITGVDAAEQVPGVRVLHAGTRHEAGRLVTAGGRVLAVTARGPTLLAAHERAYRAVDQISFAGRQLRRDIAHRALS